MGAPRAKGGRDRGGLRIAARKRDGIVSDDRDHKVFTLVSSREGRDRKPLHNREVIQEIKAEIRRLER